MASFNEETRLPAPRRDDEAVASVQGKYGGISAKKPLITKDHQRAYFDSADWVLGKQQQGASSNGTAIASGETLKPKLQRTAYHQLPPRRPACTSE